jgi:hypothetical protein
MKITPLIASQEIPAVQNIRVPANAYTARAEGFRALGGALGQSAEDWYKVTQYEEAIERKKQAIEDDTKTTLLIGKLKNKYDELHKNLEKFPSEQNKQILKYFDNQSKPILGELSAEAIGYHGRVYDLFQRESLPIQANARIRAREIQDLKWKDEYIADIDSISAQKEKEASELIGAGKDARPTLAFLDAILEKAQKEGAISSINLEKRRESISDRINSNVKRLQDEMRRQEEKQAETRADLYLMDQYGTNYDEAIKALDNPEVYSKKLGLTVQQASNLKGIINNRKTKDLEIKETAYKAMANDMWLMLKDKTLTKEYIQETVRKTGFPWNIAESFEKRIDEEIKGKVKTDKATYSQLLSLAWSHPDKEYVRRKVLENVHRLEDPDFERLLQTNESKADARLRESINIGKNLIERTVIPKRGLMASYLSTPKEEEDLANALTAFNDAIVNAKIKNPNIQSDEIKKIADQISKDYSKSLSERISDFTKYTTEQFKKDVQKTIGEKPKVPKMTDEQISDWLLSNGYLVTDENIRIFKEDNGMK